MLKLELPTQHDVSELKRQGHEKRVAFYHQRHCNSLTEDRKYVNNKTSSKTTVQA